MTYRDCNFGNLRTVWSSSISKRALLEELGEMDSPLRIRNTEATQEVAQLVHQIEIDILICATGSLGSPKSPMSRSRPRSCEIWIYWLEITSDLVNVEDTH